jgi:hypothetical protein
MYVLYVL